MRSFEILLLLACVVVAILATPDEDVKVPVVPKVGAPSELDGDALKEAEKILASTLVNLGEAKGVSYKISKVTSATSQVVSGTLYNYQTELTAENGDAKQCTVKLWLQPWIELGTRLDVHCEGEDQLSATLAS